MKNLSSKPTVYLIDGSNFSRSFWGDTRRQDPDALESEFLNWLDAVSRVEKLQASCFRVIFDGAFRPVREIHNPSINVYFSDFEPADGFLLERAYFMNVEGVRSIIVTNDRDIREKAAQDKIMSMPCALFYRLCDAELRKKLDR